MFLFQYIIIFIYMFSNGNKTTMGKYQRNRYDNDVIKSNSEIRNKS